MLLYSGTKTLYVSVAQGIEQRFPKPCVGGSIPLWDTTAAPYGAVFLYFVNHLSGFFRSRISPRSSPLGATSRISARRHTPRPQFMGATLHIPARRHTPRPQFMGATLHIPARQHTPRPHSSAFQRCFHFTNRIISTYFRH